MSEDNKNMQPEDSTLPEDNGPPDGKTFTQEQVNQIVSDRLSRERVKADNALAEKEQALVQREIMLTAREKLVERGLPVELCEALNTTTPEALEKALDIIQNTRLTRPGRVNGAAPIDSDGTAVEFDDIRAAMGLQ